MRPVPGLCHRAARGHGPVERSLDIDRPQQVEVFLAHLLGGHVLGDHAGRAHEGADRPELRDDALGGRLHALAVGHVAADGERAAPVGLHPGHGLGLALGVAVDAGHVGAHLRQRHGHRLPDALRGARHDRDGAGEVERDREFARCPTQGRGAAPPRSRHPLIR